MTPTPPGFLGGAVTAADGRVRRWRPRWPRRPGWLRRPRWPGRPRRLRWPRWRRRRTVRLRLTLSYTALFLAAGAALLTITYGLTASNLRTPEGAPRKLGVVTPQVQKSCESLVDPNAVDKCKRGFTSGVVVGAANQRAAALHRLLVDSLVALAVMTVASAVLGWFMAGRALRPLHAITAAARRASDTNLHERIAMTGPDDELKRLADTFDEMLQRLDVAFANQRRFIGDASHELRTPLTVMRTAIDVTLAKPVRTPAQLEGMAIEVRQAVDRAEALIDALLTLARSDRGTHLHEPTDLAVVAEDALDAAAAAAQARRLRIHTELDPAVLAGEATLLERLVGNLVDNAVRHNTDGGWLRVSTGRRDGEVFVAVVNGGAPVPEDAVESLFEPFRRLGGRADPADGVGLGLAIVRSVATAHHGEVAARSRGTGGLEVTVRLPAG